jgi:hypothetical protein
MNLLSLLTKFWLFFSGHLLQYSLDHADLSRRPDVSGLSSIFGTVGDKWQGGTLGCKPKEYALKQFVCAHRYYPCGTILILENPLNGKRSYCSVQDRGPYGAVDENGEWFVKKTAEEPGTWRGVLDIAPRPAKQLGHNGLQRIRAWRLKMPQALL